MADVTNPPNIKRVDIYTFAISMNPNPVILYLQAVVFEQERVRLISDSWRQGLGTPPLTDDTTDHHCLLEYTF